jgi:hypothetical protein
MRSQCGFAAIELLLIFVAVAIIGGTGYYVWHANQQSNDTYNASTKAAESSPIKKNARKVSNGELSIPELGVKFTVSKDQPGISYIVQTITDEQGKLAKAAYINDTALADLANKCSEESAGKTKIRTVGFAALSRIDGQYDADKEAGEASLIKQFPTFHILYSVPNGAICGSESESVKTQFFAAMHKSQSNFYDSFKATAVEIQ